MRRPQLPLPDGHKWLGNHGISRFTALIGGFHELSLEYSYNQEFISECCIIIYIRSLWCSNADSISNSSAVFWSPIYVKALTTVSKVPKVTMLTGIALEERQISRIQDSYASSAERDELPDECWFQPVEEHTETFLPIRVYDR